MRYLFMALMLVALLYGCASANRSNQPQGMTGTGTSGSTTGTGNAAPTGTVGTGGTAPAASPGQVIPKEGESRKDDSAITETVKKSLSDAGFPQIEVETHDGVVTLKGKVNQAQVDQVIKLVQTIPEVESVTSELTVD